MQQAHGQGGSHRAPLAGPPPAPGGGPVSGPLPGGGVWIDLEQFEVLLIGEQRRALCEVEPAAAVHAAKKMMQSFRDQECFKGRQLLQVLLYFTGAEDYVLPPQSPRVVRRVEAAPPALGAEPPALGMWDAFGTTIWTALGHGAMVLNSPMFGRGAEWELSRNSMFVVADMPSLPPCCACGIEVDKVRRCAACTTAVYCSPERQKRHWPDHRSECRRLRQERAAAGAAARRRRRRGRPQQQHARDRHHARRMKFGHS